MNLKEAESSSEQNQVENKEGGIQKPAAIQLPRKNLIPPRRISFEKAYKAPQVIKKSPFSSDVDNNIHLKEQPAVRETPIESRETREHLQTPSDLIKGEVEILETRPLASQKVEVEILETRPLASQKVEIEIAGIETQRIPVAAEHHLFTELPTTPMVVTMPASLQTRSSFKLTRGRAIFLTILLAIVIINATTIGFSQFFGPQGWGSVLNSSSNNGGQSLLKQIGNQLHLPTPGATAKATAAPPTPLQIVDALLSQLTLDEKLGQMLVVRFNDQSYLPDISAMISQYKVGSVIDFQGNIASKSQLAALNAQMQQNAFLPLIIAVDQEGGTVDRLANLDGPQPSASRIGATGDPQNAYQQGVKDAQDLASYSFNLNLAPVVDVTNVYNGQLAGRTYGTNPTIVTEMAGAYLKGLQQSGRVLGTIKHFPGLGDTSTDPHTGLPYLTRSLESLNAVDWAPYKNLISQGNVYSIMVTHELVQALDASTPSSLSSRVVSILRNQLGFQGVIITDGLTMNAVVARYTLGEAAAMAVEAGDDLLMDPSSPNEVAQMIDGIKQAMSSGAISQQRIDASVRRILLLKYQMGLLHINS